MKQAISKLQEMLDCFELISAISGKQNNNKKEITIFAQSPLFDIKIQLNKVNKAHHFQENYVVIRAFDRLKGEQFIHTMLYLEDLDDGIAIITEVLKEHTHNTLLGVNLNV